MTTESTDETGVDSTQEQVEVRSGTVLPARRQEIELHTADGLTLVGELALPLDRDPVATLVTLHPLPTHGGFMDSHVFSKAADRLPALADIAVLRFNTARDDVAARHQRGCLRRGRGRALRRGGGDRVRRVPRPAAPRGCWAGASAPTWR